MHFGTATSTLAAWQPSLDVRHSTLDGCTSLVEVSGELDLAAAPVLKASLGQWLEGRTYGDLVLELSAIDHVDSTGLAVLVAFRRRLPDGSRMALAAPSDQMRRLLAITGLDGAFAVHASVEDAVAHLERTRGRDDPLPLTPDAAVAVGLAFTALLFADSPTAEAERWARILLPYGDSELVGELVETEEVDEGAEAAVAVEDGRSRRDGARERLERVVARATRLAAERGHCGVRTGDLVGGVVTVYGHAFARALQAQL